MEHALAKYRRLDSQKIVETVQVLQRRIEGRFPGSGLGRIVAELLRVAEETVARTQWIQRPQLLLRCPPRKIRQYSLWHLRFLLFRLARNRHRRSPTRAGKRCASRTPQRHRSCVEHTPALTPTSFEIVLSHCWRWSPTRGTGKDGQRSRIEPSVLPRRDVERRTQCVLGGKRPIRITGSYRGFRC